MRLKEFNEKINNFGPIIAIDYGSKQIGIAISNQKLDFNSPLINIKNNKNCCAASKIVSIILENLVTGIIFGSGSSKNFSCKKIKYFISVLQEKLNIFNKILPIYLHDESNTTVAAQDYLREIQKLSTKKALKIDDRVAASILLEEVLNLMKQIKLNK